MAIEQSQLQAVSPSNSQPPSCPSCASTALTPFYTVSDVPVHSCLLMDTHRQALDLPRGDVDLALCRQCGFITNTAYQQAHRAYDCTYEETQGFSAVFNEFQSDLAQRLIERYSIRKRTIVEIGCGKGDFLSLLCRLGDNHGVGIDPACVPERLAQDVASRITVLKEYYSPSHASIPADVIVCRHTLEHIADTGKFLRLMRKATAHRSDTLLFFEVPDTLRILREAAFWDVYYEHCSYFTPGSLAKLFRANGFTIEDIWLDYDDQYILLAARPMEGHGQPQEHAAEDLPSVQETVGAFTERTTRAIENWQARLSDWSDRKQRTIIWGSGSKGVAFLTTLGADAAVAYAVDINPYRQGKFMPGGGQPIVSPKELVKSPPDHVIVMNPIYQREIITSLDALGLKPEVLTVLS